MNMADDAFVGLFYLMLMDYMCQIEVCDYLDILDYRDKFKRTYRDMSKFIIAQL